MWSRGRGTGSQVRADADADEEFFLDGAMRILGVVGRGVLLAVGSGVGQERLHLGQRGQLLGRAAQDPHRLATPFHGELLARLLTKGTATAAPPTAPAPQAMMIQLRRSGSMPGSKEAPLVASVMNFLWMGVARDNPGF